MANTNIDVKKLEQFMKVLNAEPPADKIKKMQNFYYLPISYHEVTLDRLFFGLWSSRVLQSERVLNEIICTVEVTYTHPVNGKDYSKTGVASVQIQQDANTKIQDFATCKKANALQLCLPKARAEAFKNATQQIGKIFGRDLGRKSQDVSVYKGIMEGKQTAERSGLLMLVEGEIKEKISLQELNSYMRENIEYLSDKDIQKLYQDRKEELNQIALPQASNNDK